MGFWFKHFWSERQPHKEAFEEVVFVCGLSLIPLIFLPIIEHVRLLKVSYDTLWQAVSSGQLYLYSFSLLGTLYWLSQKDRNEPTRFPPRKYIVLLILLPMIVIITVYSVDPTLSRKLSEGLIWTSIAIYTIYVFLYYILLVFEKLPIPSTEKALVDGSEDLMKRYREGNK